MAPQVTGRLHSRGSADLLQPLWNHPPPSTVVVLGWLWPGGVEINSCQGEGRECAPFPALHSVFRGAVSVPGQNPSPSQNPNREWRKHTHCGSHSNTITHRQRPISGGACLCAPPPGLVMKKTHGQKQCWGLGWRGARHGKGAGEAALRCSLSAARGSGTSIRLPQTPCWKARAQDAGERRSHSLRASQQFIPELGLEHMGLLKGKGHYLGPSHSTPILPASDS